MKHLNYLWLASFAALASCSSDEYLGEQNNLTQNGSTAILFGAKGKVVTRSTATGSTAASKLNQKFVVYGTKHASAEDNTATNDKLVFNQYQIGWTDNSAGTSEDNTHNWGYVGKTAYAKMNDQNVTQTIKYWDLDATDGYTFYAFSSSDISYPANASDLVAVTKTVTDPTTAEPAHTGTVYGKGYSVTIKSGASLDNLYYSDRLEVPKTKYGDPVVMTFRNFGAKVRVGFYETIPGYSVKIDKFYYDSDASTTADPATAPVVKFANMVDAETSKFVASVQNVKDKDAGNQLTVTYYSDGDVKNQAKVTNTTVDYNYNLTLGTGINSADELAVSAASPTWDQTDGAYTTIYPFEANTNPMLIRVDYTLTSEDGSGEEIHVKNARAIVPTQYVQWKSNTAYTYLFKISNNTNGTTGTTPTDPDDPSTGDKEGLFPITFDAVVIATEDGMQETITTLATNSVTTYAKGKITDEYTKDEPIYVVTMSQATGHAVIAPTAIGEAAGNAQVYAISGINADDATEADVLSKLTGMDNNITLTAVTGDDNKATLVQNVPANDETNYDFGTNGAVKFTPASAAKYAFVYCTTAYVAPTETSQASATYSPSTTYYFKTSGGVYSAASGLSAENFDTYKASLYTLSGGTAGDYTVKVIRVKN